MTVQKLCHSLRLTLPLALFSLLPLVPAAAAPFVPVTQSGIFTADNDKRPYLFSLTTAQTLYFYTTSFAGGPNADGTTAPSGGFDPVLSLFDGTGAQIISNDDDPVTYHRPKAGTDNLSLDSYFAINLTGGSYTLVLTQVNNTAAGDYVPDNPEKGFTYDGPPNNYTSALNGFNGPGGFYDPSGVQDNGNYTFNISATAPAAPVVPEASTTLSLGLMLALGVGGLTVKACRRSSNAK